MASWSSSDIWSMRSSPRTVRAAVSNEPVSSRWAIPARVRPWTSAHARAASASLVGGFLAIASRIMRERHPQRRTQLRGPADGVRLHPDLFQHRHVAIAACFPAASACSRRSPCRARSRRGRSRGRAVRRYLRRPCSPMPSRGDARSSGLVADLAGVDPSFVDMDVDVLRLRVVPGWCRRVGDVAGVDEPDDDERCATELPRFEVVEDRRTCGPGCRWWR